MTGLIKPAPWSWSPAACAAPSLARKAHVLLTEWGGRPADLTGRVSAALGADGTIAASREGRCVYSNGVGIETTGGVDIPAGADVTFEWVGRMTAWSGANPGFMREDDTGDTFFILQGTTGRPWIRWDGTDVLKPGSGFGVSLDTFHVLHYVVRSGQNAEFWVNGQKRHDNTHSTATPTITFDAFGFQNPRTDPQKVVGDYHSIAFFLSALSASEIKARAADPFAIFRPRRPVYRSAALGASASEIAVSNVAISSNTLTLTTGSTIPTGSTVTLNYTPGANPLKAADGEAVGGFSQPLSEV